MRPLALLLLSACAAPDGGSAGAPVTEHLAEGADVRVPGGVPVSGGYGPTSSGVSGLACSFTQGGWGAGCAGHNVGCFRDAWFPTVFPSGLVVGGVSGKTFATAAEVEAFLPQGGPPFRGTASTWFGQLTALELNLAYSEAGAFGAGADLAAATLTGGPYAGWTAADLAAYADGLGPLGGTPALTTALAAFNEGFESCDPATLADPPAVTDNDGDGVPAAEDCDDADARVGALLASYDFSTSDGGFYASPTLDGGWKWADGAVSVTGRGQNALLGAAAAWTDTVTFLTATADGSLAWCDEPGCEERFRLGVLARATEDLDQDEGFHGYRCAVAANTEYDCAEDGTFVQLAAYLDGAEDDIGSECPQGCPENTTFDELDRQPRTPATDVLRGDTVTLSFWAVGEDLACVFDGEGGEQVTARADDARFASGGTGLSVLNAQGVFDDLRVCEALAAP